MQVNVNSPELASFVRAEVAAGRFGSPDAVAAAAVDRLRTEDLAAVQAEPDDDDGDEEWIAQIAQAAERGRSAAGGMTVAEAAARLGIPWAPGPPRVTFVDRSLLTLRLESATLIEYAHSRMGEGHFGSVDEVVMAALWRLMDDRECPGGDDEEGGP